MAYEKNQFDYLVKWRELVYDQATWERDDFDIPLYEDAIFRYWIHRFLLIIQIKMMNRWFSENG